MRKQLLFAAILTLLAVTPARAQWLTFFFNTAYLDPLAQSPDIRILAAQSSSKVPQADVNAFDDFYLINGPGRLKVNFSGALQNKGQRPLPGWVGNIPYSNHEIFYDLQAAFVLVKANYNMPTARAGNVTVYKTVNTKQLVYSFAVSRGGNVCQQYLFTPATGGFQVGMQASCYWSLQSLQRSIPGALR